MTYDDFLNIANIFNRKSSLSQTPGFKIKFIRWDPTQPISKNNIILLSKSEIDKHKGINKTSDLIDKYGNEIYDRISAKLANLKEY